MGQYKYNSKWLYRICCCNAHQTPELQDGTRDIVMDEASINGVLVEDVVMSERKSNISYCKPIYLY